MLRLLAQHLILKERILTTKEKAKETKRLVQVLIEKAKKDTPGQRRVLLKYLSGPALTKLIYELAPRYKERKGGYVRLVKLGSRISDGAELCQLELIK